MSKWIIVTGLVVLNGILGVGVYERLAEPKAQAQIGSSPANIATVAGIINNATVVYALDVNTGALAAIRVDVTNNRVEPVAKRNVAADLAKIR